MIVRLPMMEWSEVNLIYVLADCLVGSRLIELFIVAAAAAVGFLLVLLLVWLEGLLPNIAYL